jgi:LuxR family maltose regulon positive regulatory protein
VLDAHRRAGAWFDGAGLLPEAIDHALAAGDLTAAVARIEAMFPLLFGHVDLHEGMRSWLSALPDEQVRAQPMLCLAHAWILINRFDLVGAITWTETAATALSDSRSGRVFGAVAALQAFLGPHRALAPERVLELAETALRELGPDDVAFRVAAGVGLGQACYALDRPGPAEQAFAEAAEVGWGGGIVHSAMIATSYQIWVQRAVGARRRALRTCRAAMDRLSRRRAAPPAFGVLSLQLADLECDGTDLATAERLAAEGFAVLRSLPEPGLMLMLAVQSTVRVALASGDVDTAEAALAEVVTLAGSGPTADLARLVTAGQARVSLARGDVAAAVAWLDGEPGPWREFYRFGPHVYRASVEVVCLTPARILIRHGLESGDAASLYRAAERLEHARSFTGQECLRSLRIDQLVLHALVRDGLGDRAGALDAVSAAAAQAAPEGIVRPFVEAGPPMVALLEAARGARGGVATADLDVLLAAFPDPATPVPRRAAAHPGVVEPLTLREQDVLRLLAQGRSNAEIARELFVGESTVKTHLGSVYRKLGVRGRTHALARVRDLDLLDGSSR